MDRRRKNFILNLLHMIVIWRLFFCYHHFMTAFLYGTKTERFLFAFTENNFPMASSDPDKVKSVSLLVLFHIVFTWLHFSAVYAITAKFLLRLLCVYVAWLSWICAVHGCESICNILRTFITRALSLKIPTKRDMPSLILNFKQCEISSNFMVERLNLMYYVRLAHKKRIEAFSALKALYYCCKNFSNNSFQKRQNLFSI